MLPLETRSDHLGQYRMEMRLLAHRSVEMLSCDQNKTNKEKVRKMNVQKAIENVFVDLQDLKYVTPAFQFWQYFIAYLA